MASETEVALKIEIMQRLYRQFNRLIQAGKNEAFLFRLVKQSTFHLFRRIGFQCCPVAQQIFQKCSKNGTMAIKRDVLNHSRCIQHFPFAVTMAD